MARTAFGMTRHHHSAVACLICWLLVAAALANEVNLTDLTQDALHFSSDSGATWTRLPTLNGPVGSYGDASYLGANQQALATPDGTVIAAFWTSFADVSNQNPSAGVVSLRRGDSTWQVFAPGGVSAWQLAGGPGAVRVWGLQAMSDEPFVSMAVP